jgi:hypothetical protein
MDLEIRADCIGYKGIMERIDLHEVFYPTSERLLAFQEAISVCVIAYPRSIM